MRSERIITIGLALMAGSVFWSQLTVHAMQIMPPMGGGTCTEILMSGYGGTGCYCAPYDATHSCYCVGHQFNGQVCSNDNCTMYQRSCFTNKHTMFMICPLGSACGPMMGCTFGPEGCKLFTQGCIPPN